MLSPNSGQELENLTFGNGHKQNNAVSLDEFLKNAISVEDGSSASVSDSPAPSFPENPIPDVWNDIVRQEHGNRQLGETTLEEYFVRAGMFHQNSALNPQPLVPVDPTPDWFKYPMAQPQEEEVTLMESNLPVPESVYRNLMPSSESQVGSEKKRRYSDEMDKTIERRQKRMIKNRESAARSRARKQAHTILLENQVDRLKETNRLLKQQKEVDDARQFSGKLDSQPNYQLRRTSSAKF